MADGDNPLAKFDPQTLKGIAATSAGFLPMNVGEAMEMAKLMAASTFVPPHLRGSAGNCLAVVIQARQWEMNPYQVGSKSYFVNDRIAFEAQLVHAIVNTRAPLKKRLRTEYSGEGPTRRCTVTGELDGETETLTYTTPEVKDITVKNSPLWKSDPDQQLHYYGVRAWARRWVPEVLMGIYTAEEVEQLGPDAARDISNDVTVMADRPTRAAKAPKAEKDAPQPVRNFMLKAGGTEVMGMTSGDFSDALIRALTSTPASQVDAIWQQNAAMIAALPDGGAQIRKVYDAIKAKQPQPVEDSYTLVDEAGEPKSTHKTPDAWSRAFWDAIKPNDKGAQTKSNVMYVHHNSDVYLDTMRDLTEDDALVTQIDDAIRAITKIVAEEEAAREAAKTKPKEAAPVTQAESAPAPTPAAPAAPERLAAPTKNGKVESAGYLTMFVAAIEACEKPEDVATRVRLEEPNLKSVVPGTRRVCMQKGLARWTALGGAIETWPEATKPS